QDCRESLHHRSSESTVICNRCPGVRASGLPLRNRSTGARMSLILLELRMTHRARNTQGGGFRDVHACPWKSQTAFPRMGWTTCLLELVALGLVLGGPRQADGQGLVGRRTVDGDRAGRADLTVQAAHRF